MVYDLPLAEEKVKPHQVTTLHLVSALGFIGAGAIIAVYNYVIPMWGVALLVAGISLLCLTIFRNKWLVSNANFQARVVELLISLAVTGYSATQNWKFPLGMFGALSLGLMFALYWERRSDSVLYVHVDDSGLRLPVVRRRMLPWAEVEDVVLRFSTLTINCTDNHLFQWSIADTKIDSEHFEAYCMARIEENKGKRVSDDW